MAVSKPSLRGADAERKGRGISMLLGTASVVLLIQIVVCVGIYQPFSKRSESMQNIASKNPIWRGTSAIRETLLQHSLSLLSETVPNLTAPVTPDRSAAPASNVLYLPNQADNGGANGAPADANPLKVYMYTLPEKFNWGMLPEEERDKLKNFPRGLGKKPARDWLAPSDPTTYPNYGGSGARRQHSVAYYLTLSLFTGLPSVELVTNPDDAQVYFIPYFSSLSYNLFQFKSEAKDKPTDRQGKERPFLTTCTRCYFSLSLSLSLSLMNVPEGELCADGDSRGANLVLLGHAGRHLKEAKKKLDFIF